MHNKWFFFSIRMVGICLVFVWMSSSLIVQAESVSSFDTKGSIGFHGIYESENKPKPIPPDGVNPAQSNGSLEKTVDGKLPQLGQLFVYNWIWIVFVFIGLFLLKRKSTTWKII